MLLRASRRPRRVAAQFNLAPARTPSRTLIACGRRRQGLTNPPIRFSWLVWAGRILPCCFPHGFCRSRRVRFHPSFGRWWRQKRLRLTELLARGTGSFSPRSCHSIHSSSNWRSKPASRDLSGCMVAISLAVSSKWLKQRCSCVKAVSAEMLTPKGEALQVPITQLRRIPRWYRFTFTRFPAHRAVAGATATVLFDCTLFSSLGTVSASGNDGSCIRCHLCRDNELLRDPARLWGKTLPRVFLGCAFFFTRLKIGVYCCSHESDHPSDGWKDLAFLFGL